MFHKLKHDPSIHLNLAVSFGVLALMNLTVGLTPLLDSLNGTAYVIIGIGSAVVSGVFFWRYRQLKGRGQSEAINSRKASVARRRE